MDLDTFRRSLKEEYFDSSAVFAAKVVSPELEGDSAEPAPALRALAVLMFFKVVRAVRHCKKARELGQLSSGQLLWRCCENHSNGHFFQSPQDFVRSGHVHAFLHFLVYMKMNEQIETIVHALGALHEIAHATVFRWEKKCHETIVHALGALHEIAHATVFRWEKKCHEAGIGRLGSMAGPRGNEKTGKWGATADKRSQNRRLWFGVQTGGERKRSHKDGTKRVAGEVLDHPNAAKEQKPRGGEALAEVFQRRLTPHTKVVSDGWLGAESATKRAGVKRGGSCNHGKKFRNEKTGFHSNDAESEVAWHRRWARSKWTMRRTLIKKDQSAKQSAAAGQVAEHVWQTNAGDHMYSSMSQALQAFTEFAGVGTWAPCSLG
ncbi:unnamed protein product [Prorocentrum cordatum]|uniref:Uncharacterized protein n=1 Tax=Prorocentrum cordatum TaxID=2364126 RepID=A0ABN9SVX9_9DINO|nr:unnamed protein product [Polarella glacialis]